VLLDAGEEADLVVVGSRGRGGFSGLLLGSVGQAVVHHATTPVAVIRPESPLPDDGDVVVGIDGSEPARAALLWAAGEAITRGARLVVVHAWWTPVAVPPAGMVVAPFDSEEFEQSSERLLHETVEGVLSRLDQHPREVELLALEQPAANALVERAKGASLVVVGSRGRGGFAGMLLGSVSQQVLHHAHCAVVVVPHPPDEAA
jgi:nucleotide-binding universal stress UspA family protein